MSPATTSYGHPAVGKSFGDVYLQRVPVGHVIVRQVYSNSTLKETRLRPSISIQASPQGGPESSRIFFRSLYQDHISARNIPTSRIMFSAPAQDTQRPTHPRLHVRDARDAHIVFEAVRQGLLKPVVRRLNELERASYIQSGSIFVWEESDDEMGLQLSSTGKLFQPHL